MIRTRITGATRGIGRAIARSLAREGHELMLLARDRARLEAVCDQVRSEGAVAFPLVCDLSDPDQVAALAASVPAGPIDAIVNNAGLAVVAPLAEISLTDWQRSLAINVTAPFVLIRALSDRIPAGGTIVNILSIAARTGFPGWTAYCAAKAGLDGLSRALRAELRPRGVRVVTVVPAATDTPLWEAVPGEWSRDRMLDPDEVAAAVRYALERPAEVLMEDLVVGHVSGAL